MTNSQNEEEEVECPVCGKNVLKRGLFMHVFQSDDPEGERHGPRFEVPQDISVEDIKVTGTREVQMNYPKEQNLDDQYYLDTYTGKAYQGKRGLMVHLGQKAGKDNIPEDVTERHDAEDFPQVEIDDDGNITEVKTWPSGDVPPLEPYLPWFTDRDEGYVSKQKIKEFADEIEQSTTGAVSADAMRRKLL